MSPINQSASESYAQRRQQKKAGKRGFQQKKDVFSSGYDLYGNRGKQNPSKDTAAKLKAAGAEAVEVLDAKAEELESQCSASESEHSGWHSHSSSKALDSKGATPNTASAAFTTKR